MNDIFMSTDKFGDLYLTDILIEYIYPRAFICENNKGESYLFYEINSTEYGDTWYVVKIHESLLQRIKDSSISIQTAYTHADNEYFVYKDYSNDNVSVGPAPAGAIGSLPKAPVFAEQESLERI